MRIRIARPAIDDVGDRDDDRRSDTSWRWADRRRLLEPSLGVHHLAESLLGKGATGTRDCLQAVPAPPVEGAEGVGRDEREAGAPIDDLLTPAG